jgi:hypothetical protein
MIQCFLLAGEMDQAGQLPSVADMAWRFRADEDVLLLELNDLAKAGILTMTAEGWLVTNFAVRQMAISNSERAKRWREKNMGVNWAKNLYKGLPASPGVYRITCTKTSKNYIGATNNIHTRIKQNLYSIAKDIHPMSADVLEHGVESLRVEVLELIEDEALLPEAERSWLSKYTEDDLYNRETPKPHQAWAQTDETRLTNEKRTKRSQIRDIDIDKEYIYAHDLPEPILNLRTAIVAVVKEALWDETKDRFDDAATVLLGYDATPDQVADFGKWWEKNPQYPGKPALTSLVNNWNNFRAGVVTKTSRLDVGRLWQVVKHQASKGKPEFEDEDVKEAVRLTGWPALQQMSAGQEMMLKKRFEENYDNVKRSRKNS